MLSFRHKKTCTMAGSFIRLVPEDGLEPSRSKATDFEKSASKNTQ